VTLAGFVYDRTANYDLALILLGLIQLVGAFFMFVLFFVAHYRKRQAKTLDVIIAKPLNDDTAVDTVPVATAIATT